MRLILEEKFNKHIKNEFVYDIYILEEGLYVIEISGRAKSWLQNTSKLISFFKDDDLIVKIDGREFPKLTPLEVASPRSFGLVPLARARLLTGLNGKKGLFDSEAAWNGNKLKNLSQINVFFAYLDSGKHSLQFVADQSPLLETIRIYQLTDERNIIFEPVKNYKIESGNRRPWLNFILIDLAPEGLKIQASASQKHSDDDDLQLKINGERQINDATGAHKYWYWCGRILKGQSKTFDRKLNLPVGLHYVELWADNSPILEKAELFLKIEKSLLGKIALHQDIEKTDFVNLRKTPDHQDDSNIILKLKDGDVVEILEERVFGSWVPARSYIWHKVKFKAQTGYILSSFIEIKGQGREIVINKIKTASKKIRIDENLVLALAGCESRYKPYASSRPFEEKDEVGKPIAAQGIFQLASPAIDQLLKNKNEYYYEVKDPLDIEQNINGGLIYLKWLFDTYYKNQETEKLIAAYNQGQRYFPPNEPLDYSRLPTEEKQEEAKQIVRCVLENRKNKNWKSIIFSFVLIMIMILGGLGIWKLDQNDFLEPVLSEKEYLMAQTSSFPSVISLEDKGEVIFLNSQKKIAKKMPIEKLKLDDILKTPEEFKKFNLTHINSRVVEEPKGIFYFLAANSYSCGAQNCAWVFYQYNANKDSLKIINQDFFGSGFSFYLSPDSQKMAVISYVHGSVCDTGSYLEIFDMNSFQKEEITGFKDTFYPTTYIHSLNWKGDRQINFTAYHHDCADLAKKTVERGFTYNIESKETKLRSEKTLSSF